MINTDGSLSSDHAGYGAIARDGEGTPILAVVGSVRPESVITHELQGIAAGLTMAVNHNFRRICIGTDSKVACSYFSSSRNPPWRLLPLWHRIKRLCGSLESFRICHVLRQANRAADYLASTRPTREYVEIIPDSFAEDLKKIVFEDCSNTVYYRM
ncbi:Ribonuclease H domain [Macleaya cordata]|uniref:Ribonuclease H domain n=1 Tax=Macleaya cordata TaxID=56857 RepID=A0A200QKB7_MACCD|nr:Ribonuclease H domain [Macleaya cordata]